MKIIRNNIIPFKGYKAINIFGVLFLKKNAVISEDLLNHESIHTEQMKELLYIGFYIIYFLEWLFRSCVSFEKEAYDNEDDLNYLDKRKHFAMWRK